MGYACATTNYTLSQLKKGGEGQAHTYLHVREDIFELYGFASQQELNSFAMLIGVRRRPPRQHWPFCLPPRPRIWPLSIVTRRTKRPLTAAQGIGKKIAQRIILELKDKLAKEQSSFTVQGGGCEKCTYALGGNKSGEAAAALRRLLLRLVGDRTELKSIDMDALPLEEIIRQALKKW